eukprot:10534585-Alexandrium_andersonii.AAC.1
MRAVRGQSGVGEQREPTPSASVEECLLPRRPPGASSPRSCACRVCTSRRVAGRSPGRRQR